MSTAPAGTTVLGGAALLAVALAGHDLTALAGTAPATAGDLTGTWVSADGAVRLELRADGRYERGVAGRRRRSRGHYLIDGPCLLLQDDNGLRTLATLTGDRLELAGHRLHRR